MSQDNHVYILRKFVVASSITEAVRKDSSTPVYEAYLTEDSVKDEIKSLLEYGD